MSQEWKDLGLKFAMGLAEQINYLCLTPDFAVSVWMPILAGLYN